MPGVNLTWGGGGDSVGVLGLGVLRRWLVRGRRAIIIVKLIQLALLDYALRVALDIRGVDDQELFCPGMFLRLRPPTQGQLGQIG